jgi:hypothetical protein
MIPGQIRGDIFIDRIIDDFLRLIIATSNSVPAIWAADGLPLFSPPVFQLFDLIIFGQKYHLLYRNLIQF